MTPAKTQTASTDTDQLTKQPTPLIKSSGFTSKKWCAAGIRCRNDKSPGEDGLCKNCKLTAHIECLFEEECASCNANIVWNGYAKKWIKSLNTTPPTNTTNQTTTPYENNNTDKNNLNIKCGAKHYCRNKETDVTNTIVCTICLDNVHSDCINAGAKESEAVCVGCITLVSQQKTVYEHQCASGIKCRASQEKTFQGKCQTCNGMIHMQCIMNNICMQCDKSYIWNPHKKIWVSTRSAELEQNNENSNQNKTLDTNTNESTNNNAVILTDGKTVNLQETNGNTRPILVAPKGERITKLPTTTGIIERPNRSAINNQLYTTRTKIRINMQAKGTDNNLHTQLLRQIQELLGKLSASDPSLRVLPWKEKHGNDEIGINNIPKDQSILSKFFPRLTPKKDGFIYGEMRIRHKKKIENIITDSTPWLSEHKHGLYFQALQSEEVSNIGWLAWSFRKIDTTKLENEIWQLYNINVNLRYQNIVVSRERNNLETVRALHIITSRNDMERAINLLKNVVYAKSAIHFPLGTVMRFVPHAFKIKRPERIEKIKQWRIRQQIFLNGIEGPRQLTATSWEIVELDKKQGSLDTLQKLIMAIELKKLLGDHLFLSVDCSFFRSNEVIFSFLPRHEQEARDLVANLVPYILNTFSKEQESIHFFHQEAVERANTCQWDSTQREVISALDKYVDDFELLDDYDGYSSQQTATEETTIENIQDHSESMRKVEQMITGEETESIGTILTTVNESSIMETSSIHINNSNMTHSLHSVSAQSLNSKKTEQLESKVDSLTSNVLRLENLITTLMITLAAKQQSLQSKPTIESAHMSIDQDATASNREDGCSTE